MDWTPQQREAIEYKGENVLLAAAAGSGKTAVLVERLIELIESGEVSVNELLVLTFTDAAAGEMREKIKKAIGKALAKNPDNQHMQKQKLLIHSASISTVHSFCLNLLKSNIHLTDLPVDFSLISELENKIMFKEALDEVQERFYKNIDKDSSFANLAVGYGGIKNDSGLREFVTRLHNFSRSMAYPSQWLNYAVRAYRETAKTGRLQGEWWRTQLKDLVEKSQKELFDVYAQIEELLRNTLDATHPYHRVIGDDVADIKRVFEHIDSEDYTSVRSGVYSMSFGTLRGRNKPEPDLTRAQNRIKHLRELATGIFGDLKECFALDETTVVDRIRASYPALRTLKNIVLMTDRCYRAKKREKSLLDFNDLEHEALKLLVSPVSEATEVALRLREKYKAILVDEYQDTNNIQDLIFKTVSRDNKNIFMVGDLKQSIYKFRNAVPKLFSEKYSLYGQADESGHLIRLFKNFRSRQGVVNTVNALFSCVMSPEVGDIDYTPEEYLVKGAGYPDVADEKVYDTEFHLICADFEDSELSSEQKKEERSALEARVAADRIKKMVDEGVPVFDKETGSLRPMEYRDIVVLMRKTKGVAPIFEQVFEESGIPVYSDVGHKYLESLEIQTVLSFLQIVDNPRQDIPLIAVMRSPMWGFSADELAEMRSEKKYGCFFDVVAAAAKRGNEKAQSFLAELSLLRKNAEYMGVDDLIHQVLFEYGYMAYVGSLDHGAERQANLRVLLERATEFERTNMSGLFSFMNYIDTMIAEEKDMTPAKTFGEGENVVKIMSIHKSKGLEFPVVILVNTANEFNLKDASRSIVWDEQGGIGLDYVELDRRIKYTSLPKTLVGLVLKKAFISEEMRLLYVALTRAREKLIVTSVMKSSEKKWKKLVWNKKGIVPSTLVRNLHTYKEWLLGAFLQHPKAVSLRQIADISEEYVDRSVDYGLDVYYYESPEKVPEISKPAQTERDFSDDCPRGLSEGVDERLEFRYSDAVRGDLPVKLSVSEVKRMQNEDEMVFTQVIRPLRTDDMAEMGVLTGAEKGTIVHFVMQMLDPKECDGPSDVAKKVFELVTEEIISPKQAKAVDCERIARFFESPVGQRMKKAVRCETEFSFYSAETAEELLKNGVDDEVLLQGTIDCFFVEEDGTVVLLDYKTDRAKTRDDAVRVAERYKVQLKYYKRALSKILDRAVDECYLYFMDCGEIVSVTDEEMIG